ncbi:MAG: DUF4433 domain-containing protein, partial [Lachnoclostridium sp.]|nr:DUF4433 domain-containing protein [Lachnoclostridium sp.]
NQIENIETIFKRQLSTFKYPRTPDMLACCPTDGQAEILIEGNIPRDYLFGIVVGNEDIAKRVYAMLEVFGVKQMDIYISQDVLTSNWSNLVKQGNRPEEVLYDGSGEV